MRINHTKSIASTMASGSSIEYLDSYEDNVEYYQENNFTYIPMPFEGKFYNIDSDDIEDIQKEQYIKEDATIRQTVKHLTNYPFLLVEHKFTLYRRNDGSLSTSMREQPEDTESLGIPMEAFENYPDLRQDIVDLCNEKTLFWIITLADVNRRTVKEAFYPVIAELETRFVSELRDSDKNPQEFFPDLSPQTIGRWEKAKHSGMEMDISEYMKLSEMMKIIAKDDSLREKFGYSSRNQFDNGLGGLIDLRNKIMHSSRTLVQNYSDLENLNSRISRAESVIENHGGEINRATYDVPFYQ